MDELKELKKTLQEVGEAFHEFKKQNDERLKNIEAKGTGGDAAGNTEEINKKLTELTDQKKALEDRVSEMEKKASRIQKGGDETDADKAAHKSAFEEYFFKGVTGDLSELQKKALEVGSDPSGGYTVHADIETESHDLVPNVVIFVQRTPKLLDT